jgi:y4mF family transcriptional regulator
MAEFKETATERLLREERERQKLFGGLSDRFHKIGGVGQALEEAMRPYIEIQRLAGADDPFRYAKEAYSETTRDPVKDQIEKIWRDNNSALGLSYSEPKGYPPSKVTQPSPSQANPHGSLTSAADIGALIRKARKALKLSQTEFAQHAGVGRRFVSELEAGKPSLEFDKVLAAAAAAGIDITARARRAG